MPSEPRTYSKATVAPLSTLASLKVEVEASAPPLEILGDQPGTWLGMSGGTFKMSHSPKPTHAFVRAPGCSVVI